MFKRLTPNFIIALAVLLVVGLFMAGTARAEEECYSNGTRVGTIQKFSRKGVINKSWEGELVMDGMKMRGGFKTGTSGGNVWKFSVLDADVAKAIDDAALSGNEVALRYCQVRFQLGQTDTDYRITKAVERK